MNIDVKYALIRKMARRDYYGSRFINFSDLIRVVPSHLRGKAKKEIEELFKLGFLNRKPGIKGEFRYSLKSELRKEIEEILKRGYF